MPRILGPFQKTGLCLTNVLKTLSKTVALAISASIQKKNFRFGYGYTYNLKQKMDDIMNIVKYLEESG